MFAGCTRTTMHITNRRWLGPGCYRSWRSRTTFANYTYILLLQQKIDSILHIDAYGLKTVEHESSHPNMYLMHRIPWLFDEEDNVSTPLTKVSAQVWMRMMYVWQWLHQQHVVKQITSCLSIWERWPPLLPTNVICKFCELVVSLNPSRFSMWRIQRNPFKDLKGFNSLPSSLDWYCQLAFQI